MPDSYSLQSLGGGRFRIIEPPPTESIIDRLSRIAERAVRAGEEAARLVSAKWISTTQVARRLGVSLSTVERLKADAEAHGASNPPWSYFNRRLQRALEAERSR